MIRVRKLFVILLFIFPVTAGAQTTLDTAVNFTVKDVNGITHRLNEYLEQGKMVLVDFFTITCGPCVTYAPEINASYENFGCNGGNVVFLGINWGANNQQVLEFGETYGAYYPAVSGLEGNGNHVVADYLVLSYPTVILIQPGGLISENYIWPPSQQHLDSVLVSYGAVQMPCNTEVIEPAAPGSANLIRKVFPNPTTGFVNIEISSSAEGELLIMNASGHIVRSQKTGFQQADSFRFSLEGLPRGYYRVILKEHGTIVGSAPLVTGMNQ